MTRIVLACSVCLGNPDSPQIQGMNQAILFLLAVTAAVLASFAAFFLCLWRRAASGGMAGAGGTGPCLGATEARSGDGRQTRIGID